MRHAGRERDRGRDRGIVVTVLDFRSRRDRGVCAGRGSDRGKAVISLTSLRSMAFWHLPTREEMLTGNKEVRIRIRYLAGRLSDQTNDFGTRVYRDTKRRKETRIGVYRNKWSGSGERREGLGKELAAVLYTIWPQTDCWKKNDDGGRENGAYSLIDAGSVLNRDHNDLLKHCDLDLDCVTVVHPPGHGDCREFTKE